MIEVRNYVNGEWVRSSGTSFESFNANTGESLSRAAATTPEEVGVAVAAAKTAFARSDWRERSGSERAKALLALADALEKRRQEAAEIIAREMGKPVRISLSREVDGAVDKLRFYAGAARMLEGHVNSATIPSLLDLTLPEPVGVCALIIPWNDPIDLAIRKIGAALAAGCTAVVKSSEITPASTALLFETIHDAKCLPPGVLNLVSGPGDPTGEALITHPDVAKISFTGSTSTGIRVMAAASRRLARVSLECGGKLPAIVFADADLDRCPTRSPTARSCTPASHVRRARACTSSVLSMIGCSTAWSTAAENSRSATRWIRRCSSARWPPASSTTVSPNTSTWA